MGHALKQKARRCSIIVADTMREKERKSERLEWTKQASINIDRSDLLLSPSICLGCSLTSYRRRDRAEVVAACLQHRRRRHRPVRKAWS